MPTIVSADGVGGSASAGSDTTCHSVIRASIATPAVQAKRRDLSLRDVHSLSPPPAVVAQV